jgi:hypothetical protein
MFKPPTPSVFLSLAVFLTASAAPLAAANPMSAVNLAQSGSTQAKGTWEGCGDTRCGSGSWVLTYTPNGQGTMSFNGYDSACDGEKIRVSVTESDGSLKIAGSGCGTSFAGSIPKDKPTGGGLGSKFDVKVSRIKWR